MHGEEFAYDFLALKVSLRFLVNGQVANLASSSLARISSKVIFVIEFLDCVTLEFIAVRVISRSCLPEEDLWGVRDRLEDDRGVKKRVNRFGVTVGGFLSFPDFLLPFSEEASGEEKNCGGGELSK